MGYSRDKDASHNQSGFDASELRIARRRRRWSQGQLAHRVGVSRETVNRWEAGRTRPSVADLGVLAQALRPPSVPAEAEIDIRKLRGQLRWSQQQLANAIGVHRVTVLEWESGRKMPNGDHWELLLQLRAGVPLEPCYFTLPEIASKLRVHPKTLQVAARRGKFPAFKDTSRRGTWRATLDTVRDWLARRIPQK